MTNVTTYATPIDDLVTELVTHLDGFTVRTERNGRHNLHVIDARGLMIEFSYSQGRVEVHAYHADSYKVQMVNQRPRWPRATYDANRAVLAMARDIKRRVIDPSAEVLEKMFAVIAEQDSDRAKLQQIARDLEALRLAGLRATANEHTVDVSYHGKWDGYLSARISPRGSVTIERTSVPLDGFRALLAALAKV
jgi:hypothetical protein